MVQARFRSILIYETPVYTYGHALPVALLAVEPPQHRRPRPVALAYRVLVVVTGAYSRGSHSFQLELLRFIQNEPYFFCL